MLTRFQASFLALTTAFTLSGWQGALAEDPFRAAIDSGNKAYAAGDYAAAEKQYKAALKLVEKSVDLLGSINKAVALSNLGTIYTAQNKYEEADKAYVASLDIQDKLLDGHHEQVAQTLSHYAVLLRKTKKDALAERVETAAHNLQVKVLVADKDPTDAIIYSTGPGFISEQPSSEPLIRSGGTAQNIAASSIVRIIQATNNDKQLMSNPTTYQKPVYRTEDYVEGGAMHPISGIIIGGERKKREILDHYETVAVSGQSQASYMSQLAEMKQKYSLSDKQVEDIIDLLNGGGTLIETGENWLLISQDALDPRLWFVGEKVQALSNYAAGANMFVLKAPSGSKEFHARRVALRT